MIRIQLPMAPIGDPASINVYLLTGEPLTLVDTGPRTDAAWEALQASLAAHGYHLTDLRQVVATHAHPDHCGLAARIVAGSGAAVLAHSNAVSRLGHGAAGRERGWTFLFETLRRAGAPEEPLARRIAAMSRGDPLTEPVAVTRTVEEGNLVTHGQETWEVVHLPGHAPGIIGLYRRETEELITSDHLLPDINSRPGLYAPPEGESRHRHMADYVASLRRVAEMAVRIAWPAHGEPVTDAQALAERWLAEHRQQAKTIGSPLVQGEKTAYGIWQAHFPRILPLDPVKGLSEIISYLDLLEAEGRVRTYEREGLVYYRLSQ